MEWMLHNPKAAKRRGISPRVAGEFAQGDYKSLPERKSKKDTAGIAGIMRGKK